MEINNQLRTIKYKIRKFVFLLLFVLLIIFIHFTNVMSEPRFGISKVHLTIVFSGFILLYYILEYWIDFQYVYFSDLGDRIILRYYSLRPMQGLKNSIEIPKSHFVRFEILRSFLNLRPKLVLYARNKNQIAKYPPVCLSALTKKEREKIILSLQRLSKGN
jgi:hypothetical protein